MPSSPSPASPIPRPMSLWVLVWVFPISYLVAFACVGHGDSTCTLLWVVLALGGSILPALGWAKRYRLFREHPDQPWLWAQGWSTTVSDKSPTEVIILFPFILCGLGVLGVLHWGVLFMLQFPPSMEDARGMHALGAVSMLGFLVIDVMVARGLYDYCAKRVGSLVRFGRVGVILPQMPLMPGSTYQVRVVSSRGFSRLSRLKTELRCLSEWPQPYKNTDSPSTLWRIDYEHTRILDVAGRDPAELGLELELPATVKSQGSAGNEAPLRLRWLLRLTSDEPGLPLDVTLPLPVSGSVPVGGFGNVVPLHVDVSPNG